MAPPLGPSGFATRATTRPTRSDCESNAGHYCAHGPGLSDAHLSACSAGCAAAQPDYTGAPECEQDAEICQPLCEQAVARLTIACAECVIANVYWEQGHCGEWECYCPGPDFPAPDLGACASVCSG